MTARMPFPEETLNANPKLDFPVASMPKEDSSSEDLNNFRVEKETPEDDFKRFSSIASIGRIKYTRKQREREIEY